MKTHKEIKSGIRNCIGWNSGYRCDECPYWRCGPTCKGELAHDAIDCIEQLEEIIELMMIQMHGDCGTCKHRSEEDGPCNSCVIDEARPAWEYEGLPELPKKGESE